MQYTEDISNSWSEYDFYFMERSDKNLNFMTGEATHDIYFFFTS